MQSQLVNHYVLEPLAPLVRHGYKSIAARAIKGVNAWHSALTPETRASVSGRLASLNVANTNPAPKLYAPGQSPTSGHMLYVATGGKINQRTVSANNSLLEDCVSAALNELSVLADSGDVAAMSRDSFSRLFFAFDYGTFLKQKPTTQGDLQFALGIAISHYQGVEGSEFIEQLAALVELHKIRISPHQQGFDHTEDGKLSFLTFNITDKAPSLLNVVLSLRLIYLAATAVLGQPITNLPELRTKVVAAADAQGLSSNIPAAYLADDSNLQSIADLLDKVSLHKGVEQLILTAGSAESFRDLKYVLNVLRLTKLLDTVRTGKFAVEDKDKPYSDAIGLAEIVG